MTVSPRMSLLLLGFFLVNEFFGDLGFFLFCFLWVFLSGFGWWFFVVVVLSLQELKSSLDVFLKDNSRLYSVGSAMMNMSVMYYPEWYCLILTAKLWE